ncbi:MAG: hypothetical protein IT410_03790 [Candidatus Doudnabacteria bacterium]|nr:hypothetical protein [Candidatus Doudnabacteria bacterium]
MKDLVLYNYPPPQLGQRLTGVFLVMIVQEYFLGKTCFPKRSYVVQGSLHKNHWHLRKFCTRVLHEEKMEIERIIGEGHWFLETNPNTGEVEFTIDYLDGRYSTDFERCARAIFSKNVAQGVLRDVSESDLDRWYPEVRYYEEEQPQ